MLDDAPPPYDAVVFDCDSTLSAMEGVQELARGRADAAAVEDELRRLTDAAMDGRVPLEDVFGRRLELVRPARAEVEAVGRMYVERALPHAHALVAGLQRLGKRVAIVSGGLLPAVRTLASHLDVAFEDVRAVNVSFDPDGAYAGFEADSPLARAGGKIEVLGSFVVAHPALAFVGDGATDLEAAHLARRFVAFGGVERRDAVLAAAAVTSVEPDLAALAPLLLTADELETLAADPEHAGLVRAARAFL